jgi:hypothetical protein
MQRKHLLLLALIVPIAVIGCIQVEAPDKPIEINLNINIRQEVMVKLEKDVETLITDNPELFPQ